MLKEIGTQSDTRSDWYVGVVIYADPKILPGTVVMQRYYYWTVRHCFLYLVYLTILEQAVFDFWEHLTFPINIGKFY